MSFRIEHKIKICKSLLIDFKSWIIAKDAKKLYPDRVVNSIYYDNYEYQMYHDSIEGICPRKKIRIRNYPELKDDLYYLEEKTSSIEGRFKKTRNLGNLKGIYPKTIFDKYYGICDQIVEITYDREYWVIDKVRITLDTNINIRNLKKKITDSLSLNNIAVELKTSYKYPLDKLANDFPFENIRFSKYCEAFDVLNIHQ
jgi:SPX domain protein involved in polyphosphate accumulation